MNSAKPIKSEAKIEEIKDILKEWDEKYYVMFCPGIYTGLRISDIVTLKVSEVYRRPSINLREKKTRKEKEIRINPELADALNQFCKGISEDEYLIKSRQGFNKHISERQAYNIIKTAGEKAGIDNLSTHSMRKSFGYHFYKQTGDIVTLQLIFNHSTSEVTLRYIGITQESINDAMLNFSYKNAKKR